MVFTILSIILQEITEQLQKRQMKESNVPLQNVVLSKTFYDELKITNQATLHTNDKLKPVEENFQDIINSLHEYADYSENFKLTMMAVQFNDLPTDERNKMNILFFQAEMATHKGDRSLAENCLRQNLHWKTAFDIFGVPSEECSKFMERH